jgi:hypothetical protein
LIIRVNIYCKFVRAEISLGLHKHIELVEFLDVLLNLGHFLLTALLLSFQTNSVDLADVGDTLIDLIDLFPFLLKGLPKFPYFFL